MKEHQVYLQHIIDAIQKIESYVSVGKDVFLSTSHWQDATIRQLEIIGEATKQLPEDFRSKYPNIPWKRIAGLRDVLIHNYLGTDITTVWEITQKNIPELKKQIQTILHLFE
ncbi:MAG: hypothetical protein A2Z91_00355 [Deltaproteobacteria bacterium GWA2_38_16]|nr:MAG: hypothetical protein A2Z91_00355 [Deltaproteobacteria bacterium GWA2_38_16]OGQ03554.1 MAG: hypothetical protein A3D19_01760 [Deltaproteobacteria bacterium RIFCSPHIGHO2_02_FULL_38_15]OGQ33264.1 MAG: hypothetical protein A3A72_04805 [Deltaproteobacteria bacterium RIFCSPLOWO2_01_FULL_38_9]OGQ61431.1 MAG: hypothetical protein A3G92_04310 [Deltaproteobacteria bacterium RIFCSPLOWO2_12_FULL_38_8]HBQ21204.1 DUF86 domain-containing protein [Deltaproteobacteria bacterium]